MKNQQRITHIIIGLILFTIPDLHAQSDNKVWALKTDTISENEFANAFQSRQKETNDQPSSYAYNKNAIYSPSGIWGVEKATHSILFHKKESDNRYWEEFICYTNWEWNSQDTGPFDGYDADMFWNNDSTLYISKKMSSRQTAETPDERFFYKMTLTYKTGSRTEERDKKLKKENTTDRALLYGDKILLLDDNFQPVKDISHLNEYVVDIIEVGDDFVKPAPDAEYCDWFKYVKIRYSDTKGWIDGRNVFRLLESAQNFSAESDGKKLTMTNTKHVGIGYADDDGLTFCQVHTPIVFSIDEYEGVIRNKGKEKIHCKGFGVYGLNYPILEMKSDDGARDLVINIKKERDTYLLRMYRRYQEDAAELTFRINYNEQNTYEAELIEYVAYAQ